MRAWWTNFPTANIGIACGELIVVDADSAASAEWCRANLPPTPWRVNTAKGVHFYFRRNDSVEIRNSVDQNAKLDTRGLGGYVVAGGSRHHSGAYYVDEIDPTVGHVMVSDLPMLERVHVEAIGAYRNTNIGPLGGAKGNLAGFDASKIRMPADGSAVAEGGRNNAAASLAGQHFRTGLSLRDTKKLLDNWNQSNAEPLSDAELNTTIASVKQTHERNHPGQTIPLEAPELKPVTRNNREPPPFPTRFLNPPGLVGDVAAWITRTAIKPQPVLSLAAALALCGTIMGRKVETRTYLRTNVYVLGVADSSAGKEWPRQAIKMLLEAAKGRHLIGAEDLASDAALFAAILRSPSCLLLIDEIGRFFIELNGPKAQSYLKNIMAYLMKLTGSTKGSFMEKIRAEHRDVEPRVVMDPNVCLFGTTVPGRLSQGIKREDITDGFLPRMPTFQSDTPNPPKNGVSDRTPPAAMVEVIHEWVRRTTNTDPTGDLDLAIKPLVVDMTPEAQRVFEAFEAANNVRYTKTLRTGIDAMWGRADEHAMRFALILACGCSFDNPLIDRAHAEWACELVEFLFNRMILEIDDRSAENEHEGTLKKILAFIAQEGQVSRRMLIRKFRHINAKTMDTFIDTLIQSGDVRIDVDAPLKGGTPTPWITYIKEA